MLRGVGTSQVHCGDGGEIDPDRSNCGFSGSSVLAMIKCTGPASNEYQKGSSWNCFCSRRRPPSHFRQSTTSSEETELRIIWPLFSGHLQKRALDRYVEMVEGAPHSGENVGDNKWPDVVKYAVSEGGGAAAAAGMVKRADVGTPHSPPESRPSSGPVPEPIVPVLYLRVGIRLMSIYGSFRRGSLRH